MPSEDDIRKYMLENITEEQFKEMMEADSTEGQTKSRTYTFGDGSKMTRR